MLIVDLHTLQTVDVLYLIDDVLLDGRRALDLEDVGRRDGPIGERHTSVDRVALLDEELLGGRYEVLTLSAQLGRDDDLTITTLEALAEGDDAIDLSDHCGVGGVARLEELGDTGQPPSDVTRLAGRAGDLR